MMKLENKVIILGCGNGGMALAADLKLKNAKVALWADPEHANKLNRIKKEGCIVFNEGGEQFAVQPDLLSCDLSEILSFGDIIYNCTTMPVHVSLFKKLASNIDYFGATKLLINLSGVFSGIDQYLNVSNRNIFKKIKVYDTSTFPYACRAGKSNDVVVLGRKSELAIAPLFSTDDCYLDLIPDECKPSLFQPEINTFKLGLLGTNAIFHSATVLFNARLIDSGNSFLFYKEGISKKTSLLHEALDGERIMLGKAMGYELNRCVEDDNKLYGTNFVNSYDFSVNSSVHHNIKAPATLEHRFVTEDVAYGLVPLAALGKLYGVELPNIESVINIFSTIMGIDYYQCGRHLAGLDRDIIDERVGIVPASERIVA